MITKDNFISARFIDNERANIEVLIKNDTQVNPLIIPHNIDHKEFQNLMELTTIDEIHEQTANFIRETRKAFKEKVLEIAKNEGIIKTKQNTVTKKIEVEVEKPLHELIDRIFVEEIRHDNEEYKEEVFKTKLKAFDYPFVKNSKNRDLKAKLRKAETYLDIITIVCEFRKENYV